MTPRKPLRGSASLKRTARPRKPEAIRPEDYAATERPIGMCRNCRHHTSAFCGACTAFILDDHGVPTWCGCDCRTYLSGVSAEGPERSDPQERPEAVRGLSVEEETTQ